MAYYQPVMDPKTQQPTGLYFYNGAYYKTDSRGNIVPTTDTPQSIQQAQQTQQSIPSQISNIGNTPISTKDKWTDKQKLEAQALGENPTGYRGLFQKAFNTSLQQPGEVSQNVVISGTQELAEAFIDRYLEKNGKLPDAGTIKDFVSNNLTNDFAKNYIQGSVNRDQIKSQFVDPALEDLKQKDLIAQQNDPAYQQSQLQKTIDTMNQFYNPLQERALIDVKNQFNPLRARAVEEEAALGRLRSGVSADQNSAIGQVDVNQGNAFSQVIQNILGAKAGGALDYSKFGQTLAQNQANAAQAKNEFNQTLAFNKQKYSDEMDYQNKALAYQDVIGRQRAANRRNSGFAGAFGGAASGALTGTAISPGWGTLIGAGLGGLGGYFSSKED